VLPQHHLGIAGHRQPHPAPGVVGQLEQVDLYRIVQRHEDGLLHRQLRTLKAVLGVPESVPGDVTTVLGHRSGRRPDRGSVVIANVDRLTHLVRDGVVAPTSELVVTAVAPPRATTTLGGRQEPKLSVRDDVGPRRRGWLTTIGDHHVLVTVVVEPTEAIEEVQVGCHFSGQQRRAKALAGQRMQSSAGNLLFGPWR